MKRVELPSGKRLAIARTEDNRPLLFVSIPPQHVNPQSGRILSPFVDDESVGTFTRYRIRIREEVAAAVGEPVTQKQVDELLADSVGL